MLLFALRQPTSLEQPVTARKLNQNEAPADLPEPLKREILALSACFRLSWHRYPAFVPGPPDRESLLSRYDWVPAGVLVGNGSNELIQAALSVTLADGEADGGGSVAHIFAVASG